MGKVSVCDIDYGDMGCDPDDGDLGAWEIDDFDDDLIPKCADCGREASFSNCNRCGAPLCGMCAELGLNFCKSCLSEMR